jgi:hypothetical protein
MERKTAADFDQELLNLFDKYVHGDIDRRGFLERATRFAVGRARVTPGSPTVHTTRPSGVGVMRGKPGQESCPWWNGSPGKQTVRRTGH